eukprot:TRINITY_DN2744_c0_g2_i1.p1 TRINITY_DN2744_c0_g2~~TRINITY_DN2744_c0_g2_i1.p1  ORF type:complete len:1534 (-),score=290.33 TRINITY_DN2744_c0_g2_i1:542-5143(-)
MLLHGLKRKKLLRKRSPLHQNRFRSSINMWVNNRAVKINNPSPDLLLVDYLRNELGLTATKKVCAEGGCGSCTVIMTDRSPANDTLTTRSINSCLRPVALCDGKSITTLEGTLSDPQKSKSDRTIIDNSKDMHPELKNPVSCSLAANYGSQCGFCSNGWVMNISSYLKNHPDATQDQIMAALDGNLCRCTGYKQIEAAFKWFGKDYDHNEKRLDTLIPLGLIGLKDSEQLRQMLNRPNYKTKQELLEKLQAVKHEADNSKRNQILKDNNIGSFRELLLKINRLEESLKVNTLTLEEFEKLYCNVDDIYIPQPSNIGRKEGNLEITIDKKVDLHYDGTVSEDVELKWVSVDSIQNLTKLNLDSTVRLCMANTSFGVYKDEYDNSNMKIDISNIPDLHGIKDNGNTLQLGSGVTYTELVDYLEDVINKTNVKKTVYNALHYLASRTAGTIVRNAASLGGNTMMVLQHINDGTPFPSDLFTIFSGVDAKVGIVDLRKGDKKETLLISDLITKITNQQLDLTKILLVDYQIDYSNIAEISVQKTALRPTNSHSIVNSAIWTTKNDNSINIIYGGIAPHPIHATQTEKLYNSGERDFSILVQVLNQEIQYQLDTYKNRANTEGHISDTYKKQLCASHLYKSLNSLVEEQLNTEPITGYSKWEPVPESFSPIRQPNVKEFGFLQTSGKLRYTHDIVPPANTLNAAFVESTHPWNTFQYMHPESKHVIDADELEEYLIKKFEEQKFTKLVTSKDVPGANYMGMGSDQPIYADGRVLYVGQTIALVVAPLEEDVVKIARFVKNSCIKYSEIDIPDEFKKDFKEPIITLTKHAREKSVFPDYPQNPYAPGFGFYSHIHKIERPGSTFQQISNLKTGEGGTPSRGGGTLSQVAGKQMHYYFETQSCIAIPGVMNRIKVIASTQSPMENQEAVAGALGLEFKDVEIQVPHVGGGFGGKTEPTRFVSAPVAVAAKVLNIPIRLVMPRDEDSRKTGMRHGAYGETKYSYKTNLNEPEHQFKITELLAKIYLDGGAFYDCSYVVSNCIMLRFENAYNIKNISFSMDVCRTNTQPSTAFRAFGAIQGNIILENAIDAAAVSMGVDPAVVREQNMYERGEATPFGQSLTYCYMKEVWKYLKEQCKYEDRRKQVDQFNSENKWKKRGVYMIPVKYGSGYNAKFLEQSSASLSCYKNDGTIIIHQGGVEMGQGLITICKQVASRIMRIPEQFIRIKTPRTQVVPNPSSSGASTGTTYSAMAVKSVCEKFRDRILSYVHTMRANHSDEDLENKLFIDYWNYDSWSDIHIGNGRMVWQNIIDNAFNDRIPLIESSHTNIPGGEDIAPNQQFKPLDEQPKIPFIDNLTNPQQVAPMKVNNFVGWTFSAACAEVEVDLLTGETKVLDVDLVYDMGWSLNQAVDIGQIEGAFIQGLGYLTGEDVTYRLGGDDLGDLTSKNTWEYKIPNTATLPKKFNTHLFPRSITDVEENPNDQLFSSKEVGEPPLVLASAAFFAIKDAIRASRKERNKNLIFDLPAPATVQVIREAVDLDDDQY